MTLIEKIEYLLKENDINKRQLSVQAKIPYNTIRNFWIQGVDKMQLPTFRKLCDYFNVTMDSMAFDDRQIEYKSASGVTNLSRSERNLVDKYHHLNANSQRFIDGVMEHESSRIIEHNDNMRIYAYYNKIAAAGSGFYFDDIPADTIEAPYYPGADFIIGVSGDSMEPDYFDGENVYVRRSQDIPIGNVGIFTIGNECFIKERGADGLFSRNPKYDIINGNEDVRAVGEVLGKVEKKIIKEEVFL